jgi:hypothetical protein
MIAAITELEQRITRELFVGLDGPAVQSLIDDLYRTKQRARVALANAALASAELADAEARLRATDRAIDLAYADWARASRQRRVTDAWAAARRGLGAWIEEADLPPMPRTSAAVASLRAFLTEPRLVEARIENQGAPPVEAIFCRAEDLLELATSKLQSAFVGAITRAERMPVTSDPSQLAAIEALTRWGEDALAGTRYAARNHARAQALVQRWRPAASR